MVTKYILLRRCIETLYIYRERESNIHTVRRKYDCSLKDSSTNLFHAVFGFCNEFPRVVEKERFFEAA